MPFVIALNGVRTLLPVSNMSIDQSHFDRRALEGFNKSPKGSNVHRLWGQICVADRGHNSSVAILIKLG